MNLIEHATSLGAVESTVERLPPSLLRLSVGKESIDDLWDGLDQALNAVDKAVMPR